jgi:hypothetical protein
VNAAARNEMNLYRTNSDKAPWLQIFCKKKIGMEVALCRERPKGTRGDLVIFEDRADEVELELIASF